MELETKASNGRFFDASAVPEPAQVVSNPRLEVQAKMEKKHSAEEANYSYKPTLYTKPRKDSEKIDDNRYDRLYSDALKRHLESKWKESIEDKDLTFRPKISTKGSNSRSSSRERGSVSESIEQRLLGLTPKPVQVEEFSFKPKITQRAKSIDRSQLRDSTSERLFSNSKTIQDKIEAKRQEQAQRSSEECTFAPKTNVSTSRLSIGSTTSKGDLQERMTNYLAYKNQRLEEAIKQKQELEKENTTFNPVIKLTKRSSTPTSSSVFERLARTSSDNDMRSVSSERDNHLTFKPTLVAKRSASPSPRGTEYKDIHERLFKEGQKRAIDLEIERKLLQEESEVHLTFTPAINRKNSGIKETPQQQGPVFERLSATSNRMYMQEVLTKIKEDLELKDCTFKPKLVSESKLSNRESSGEPIHIRLVQEGERIKADQMKAKELRTAESLKDVTFKPKINATSDTFAKKRSSVVDIHSRLNAEKLAANLPEPAVVEAPKKVLPKEDVEKIFRRLSITNTANVEVANTIRTTGDVPESPAHTIQRKKSVVLAEKDIDTLFQRLHTTSYDHQEEDVQRPVKTLPPRAQSDLHERLNKSAAEAWLDKHDTLSPVRRSSITMSLASPSNDSYQSNNSLASSLQGTPREKVTPKDKHENRKDFFRDPSVPLTSQNLANVNPADFPPTPPPVKVQSASKNGKSTGGIAVTHVEPRVEDVPPPVPVVSVPTKVTPAVPKVAASTPVVAAPSPAVVASTSTKSATPSKKDSTASSGSSGSGANNPDFFSKLEASLAFLETQLDSKSTKSATTNSAVKPATTDAAPSYASVVKTVEISN